MNLDGGQSVPPKERRFRQHFPPSVFPVVYSLRSVICGPKTVIYQKVGSFPSLIHFITHFSFIDLIIFYLIVSPSVHYIRYSGVDNSMFSVI